MSIAPTAALQEIMDRTRRIETRLTRFMEAQGFDTQVQRPQWLPPQEAGAAGAILLPTPATSLRDCLDVVPGDWDSLRPIVLIVKDEHIGTLLMPPIS
jgi:hypothetical protein